MMNARGEEQITAVTAVEAAGPAWVPGTQFANYEIESLLATGGMAEVWRAKMKGVAGFEKRVVIKTMLTSLQHRRGEADRFRRGGRHRADAAQPAVRRPLSVRGARAHPARGRGLPQRRVL